MIGERIGMKDFRREEYPSLTSRAQFGIFPSEDNRLRISQSIPSRPSQITGCGRLSGRRKREPVSSLSTRLLESRAPFVADTSARPQDRNSAAVAKTRIAHAPLRTLGCPRISRVALVMGAVSDSRACGRWETPKFNRPAPCPDSAVNDEGGAITERTRCGLGSEEPCARRREHSKRRHRAAEH